MQEIELYDIITLSDDIEYTVLKIKDFEEKRYFLISEIDEDEEPLIDTIKIARYNSNDNTLEEVKDDNLLQKLGELFISTIEEDI